MARRGGRSLSTYVARRAGALGDVGEVERTILLVEAAGLSSRDFRGRDLVAAVERRRRANGSIAGYVSYTAFGVLALRAAGAPAGAKTIGWLLSARNADGGFGVAPASASDSDMTGAVLQALAAVGRAGQPGRARRGGVAARQPERRRRLRRSSAAAARTPSPRATRSRDCWPLARAARRCPARSATCAACSARDGSVAYSTASTQTPVWVTAQALMAFERAPLPLAAVPRAPRKRRRAAGGAAPAAAAPAGPGADKPATKKEPPATADDVDEALTPESGLTETEGAPAPAPSAGGLKLDRAGGEASEEGGPARLADRRGPGRDRARALPRAPPFAAPSLRLTQIVRNTGTLPEACPIPSGARSSRTRSSGRSATRSSPAPTSPGRSCPPSARWRPSWA